MELSWGIDLWDRLDDIINHSNVTSSFIDKFHKCYSECHHIWKKAINKQKHVLEKLQVEINDPGYTEFTMTTGLMSIINNFISIYNIKSTFSNSTAAANDELFKKSHSQLKKTSMIWANEKRKMEEDLSKQRRRYDTALRRYREKYQAMIVAHENYKKSEENRSLSRMQIDQYNQLFHTKKDEYEQSKQDYAVEFRDYNQTQTSHFDKRVVDWAKSGENIYEQKLKLIKELSNQFCKLTGDMISKLNYSVTRFSDVSTQVNFPKDAILLAQKYKTGDVPPLELQFIDMDYKNYFVKVDSKNKYQSDESSSDSQFDTSNDSLDGQVTTRVIANSNSSSSLYASSLSHDNRSDPIRSTMQSIKSRNTGTTVNPDAKFSIQKSNKIFKSSIPWKNNEQSNANSNSKSSAKQPSLYQRRGRSSARQPHNTQRSKSVTDMISNVFRSSLRLKSKDDKSPVRRKGSRERSPSQSQIENNVSDFDSDTDINLTNAKLNNAAPDIVSTPAEAIAAFSRKLSAPEFQIAEQIYRSVHRSNSQALFNENAPQNEKKPVQNEDTFQTEDAGQNEDSFQIEDTFQNEDPGQNEETYPYSYVGSCVSQHCYDSEDPSNNYLSFKTGDQFYIVRMDDGSGWMYVETVNRSAMGYVPTSYMKIRHFDNLKEAVV